MMTLKTMRGYEAVTVPDAVALKVKEIMEGEEEKNLLAIEGEGYAPHIVYKVYIRANVYEGHIMTGWGEGIEVYDIQPNGVCVYGTTFHIDDARRVLELVETDDRHAAAESCYGGAN